MKSVPTLFLGLQDWWVNWFGETSTIQWLGLFLALLFSAGLGCTIYLTALREHLSANRSPAALRALCLCIGAGVAFGLFTLLFYGAFINYVTLTVLAVCLVGAVVFYVSGNKPVTKS